MRKYTNIALPDDLVEQIDKIIKKQGLGYKSRGEFVKEAVRNSLREIKNYNSKKHCQ
jgi:metal-responsive CopG/Arc/MetJ family transcriptional regulator